MGYKNDKDMIIKNINQYLRWKLNKELNLLEIVNLFCEDYKSRFCDYSKKELTKVIIAHTNRVIKNAFDILDYESKYHEIFLSKEEIEILYIALCFHDIGKVHNKENHAIYSTIITEYLLDKEYIKLVYNKSYKHVKNCILEAISMHGNKKENKDEISYITKILRDADTLDENCGDSLVDLALLYSKGKGKTNPKKCNLNKADYSESDMIMTIRTDKKYMNKIIEKLNNPISILFYKDQIKYAKEKYQLTTRDNRGDYIISLDELIKEIENRDWMKKSLNIIKNEENI